MARQHDRVLSHYHTQSGDSLELLYAGELSAEVGNKVGPKGILQGHQTASFGKYLFGGG